ncbi:hypothetical protein FKG94_12265 [Exilibacterium tricleocarpae]|uniref:Translocation and assembly module TamB C-terminal domain-containing protein n=1 Tax=Exilibacterium tricleocarpae TaxID=2591008 RepID=A0A545TNI8_9GAMM|nr:translocation/assembly module TamB domain-containing protein [Exilibacterium tricleocarpae]TQV78789.1 hypothetical protein FKG94_12265 [Exilibacterium tricleocarpae]
MKPASALLTGLKVVLVIAFFIHLSIYAALRSSVVGRYLADQVTERVPEFEATAMSGNLIQGLRFDAEYRTRSIAITLSRAKLRIGPACLWSLQLCIDELSADTLDIVTYPDPNPVDTRGELPAVSTPLPLVFSRVRMGSITLRQAGATVAGLESLVLRGSWRGDRLRIANAELRHPVCRGRIQADIQLRDAYPLRTRVECDTDLPLGTVTGDLSGDLQWLTAKLHSAGTWALDAKVSLSPLDLERPLQASARLRQPLAFGDGRFDLQSVALDVNGTPQSLAANVKVDFGTAFWDGNNHLQLQAALKQPNPSAPLAITLRNLDGVVSQRQISGSADLTWGDQRLAISDLQLRQGVNHLSATGSVGTDTAGKLQAVINFPDLAQLWPGLKGTLAGPLALSGNLDQPDIDAQLDLRGVGYRDLAIDAGRLRFHLEQLGRKSSEITAQLQQVAMENQTLGDLQFAARGTLAQHQLSARWRHPDDYKANLACGGALADTVWRGQCSELQLGFTRQTWALRDPAQMHFDLAGPSAELAPLCLGLLSAGHNGAVICSDSPITLAGDVVSGVSLAGERLPWQMFTPWLPETIKLQGEWQFSLRGTLAGGAPEVSAAIASSAAAVHWQADTGEPLTIPVTRIAADLSLNRQQAELSWSGDAADYGRLSGGLTLDPEKIEATIAIAAARLAPLEPLLADAGVEALSGLVDADIRVSGRRDQPSLQGKLTVSDAKTQLANLPQPIEQLGMDIEFEGRTARLQGQFQAGTAPGTLNGQLTWLNPGWRGELSVDAERLLLRPDDDMEVILSPAITLALAPEQIQIAGKVAVPRARVRLKQLPAQAVSPSPDTVVVGLEKSRPEGPQVVSDITLQLGDDVVFRGFGLDTRLTGELTLKQSRTQGVRARGVVRLREGRYRAYGQALAIRQGDLIFVGDVDNPQLRVEAVREMDSDSTVVGLRATGPARNPIINLFSQPDMPEQAKLHYLLTGQAPGTSVEQDPNLIAAQTALSLGINTSDNVVNKTARALGIDNFRMSAEGGRDGPQMRLSGYLSSNLLVRYGIGVFDAVNSLTLRYKVGRNLYLEAVSGESNSLDVLWTFERE